MDTINILLQFKKIGLSFYQSDFLSVLKVVLAVYVAVLIVDIILVIVLHTPGMYFRVLKAGSDVPIARKNKMQKRWEEIKKLLGGGKENQYKLAILKADELVNEILAKVGYSGNNMGERLSGISIDQLEMIEELKTAHEVRNEIVHDKNFALDKEKAEEVLEAYQKTLESLEFI